MAHARDYDDTHDAAVLHAGVSVVPAALAAADIAGRPVAGADLLAGLVAGLELLRRLGMATGNGIIESGFIYSGLFGHFAATAAPARVRAVALRVGYERARRGLPRGWPLHQQKKLPQQ